MMPYLIGTDGASRPWRSTTLRQIGKDESFLDQIVAADPGLLGLNPYETGVSGNVVAFRQKRLSTPDDRMVIPDIVLLSDTGHVVVVEAKLGDNPELRGRAVVAQVVAYAASIANLDDAEALDWLGEDGDSSWFDLVRRTFPAAPAPERLAEALRRRMRDAEIHLVIVCDAVPDGLRELVRAVAGQAALGAFQLHVVELAPYVADGVDGVLLVPREIARTEIVSRTAVTVNYVAGTQQPGVSVVASSVDEVEHAINAARTGRSPRTSRNWDETSFFEHLNSQVNASDTAAVREMYDTIRERGYDVEWGHGSKHGEFYATAPGGSGSVLSCDSCARLWLLFHNLPEGAATQLRTAMAAIGFAVEGKAYAAVGVEQWRPLLKEVLAAADALGSLSATRGMREA